MGRWTRVMILAAALIGLAGTSDAATRGGKLTYARYADSLLLDPVLNDANVDIWILTNLYDTLLQPTADGKGVQPGLATAYQVAEDGKALPYLDEIHFVIIPDDATRILKLQAGEVDGAELIPYARVAELKADANIDMELFPSTKVEFLTLNVRPKLKDGSDNPLANEKFRHALNYAID